MMEWSAFLTSILAALIGASIALIASVFFSKMAKSRDSILIQRGREVENISDILKDKMSATTTAQLHRLFELERMVFDDLSRSEFYDESFNSYDHGAPDFSFEAFNKRIGVEVKLRVPSEKLLNELAAKWAQDFDEVFLISADTDERPEIDKALQGLRLHILSADKEKSIAARIRKLTAP